jgi:hypothetical protein
MKFSYAGHTTHTSKYQYKCFVSHGCGVSWLRTLISWLLWIQRVLRVPCSGCKYRLLICQYMVGKNILSLTSITHKVYAILMLQYCSVHLDTVCDFWLLLRYKWEFRSTGILCNADWLEGTNASGQPIGHISGIQQSKKSDSDCLTLDDGTKRLSECQ